MIPPPFEPLTGYETYSENEMARRATEFAAVMRRRRTVRQYSPRDVPDGVIEACVDAAASAPNGANMQPWHFVVVRDPAIKTEIREAAEREEQAFYAGRAPREWLEALAPLGTDEHKPYLEIAPALIVVFAQPYRVEPDGGRVKHYYVAESVGIATGLLVTALHLAGLASLVHTPSPMGFLNTLLGRPSHERPFVIVVTGYPADDAIVPAITKKAPADVATYLLGLSTGSDTGASLDFFFKLLRDLDTSKSEEARRRVSLQRQLEQVNKELWLVLSLFVIAALINFVVSADRMVLAFYTLPTVFSAYMFGRRHATLTATASVLLAILLLHFNPQVFERSEAGVIPGSEWLDIAVWGGTLIVTAYLMGTLYEAKDAQLRELRETYHGILMILRHFISKDKYTENHSYRVSVYATKIAAELEMSQERIEDIRAAALLHDIGKLDVSRQLLYKAARLTESEFEEIQTHVEKGISLLEPVGGSLRRILPIILSHHDKFDGSGYHPTHGENIPLEARIITVADVFDSLTSDRPYRKAMPPFEVREILTKGAGTEFDPQVVEAFLTASRKGEMEVPALLV